MKLIDKQRISAAPDTIWQIIHDPGNMPAWNHKCVTSETPAEIAAGATFQAAFQMRPGAERGDMLGEIIAIKTHELIHFRFTGDLHGCVSVTDEILNLVPQKDGDTLIEHVVDISRSGIPKWVQVIACLLNKFGRKAGEGPLDHIEDLVRDI